MVLQHIAYALPASLPESSVIVCPTVAGYFAPLFPHDQQVPKQLLCSLLELDPAAGPPAVLQPHRATFLRGACQSLQR